MSAAFSVRPADYGRPSDAPVETFFGDPSATPTPATRPGAASP